VLLCTDAAAEGLNFQFCGALVNYDMMWDPMRVEHRIGPIDRLGQQHPNIPDHKPSLWSCQRRKLRLVRPSWALRSRWMAWRKAESEPRNARERRNGQYLRTLAAGVDVTGHYVGFLERRG
jgi:superfamily II DNA/RNA helicase